MKEQSFPLKIAIIGCGFHAEQAYLPTLSRTSGWSVESLIDLDLTRCRNLAERYKIAHYSRTIDDIPPTVEAAIVALPHYLHGPVSCELMKKKLHVLCEKPMANTKAEAEAMIRCAQENGVHLNVGNVRRLFWSSRRVKEIVASKELGDLVSFHIEEGKIFSWPTSSGFYYDKKKSGGGVLIDTGAHVLDLLLWWLEDYPSVIKYQDDNFGGVEAECCLELRFGRSVKGSIKLSRLAKLQNKYTLVFKNGTLTFQLYDPSGVCNTIQIHRRGKETQLKPKQNLLFHDYFRQQLEAFFRSIKTGIPSTISADSIIPSIRLIEECYEKATRLALPWLQSKGSHNPSTNGIGEDADLRNLKILITGASGFIGGRIAERLYLDYENIPRCLVRNLNKLARLSRFPVEIARGDVLDHDSLVRATDGCDAVIHCAYGNTGDDDLNAKINVEGTENLIQAALQNRIKKFVHLSSVEVYGQDQSLFVDERTEPDGWGNSYGRSKFEAERLCLKYFNERSFPVVVLRLAVVYGPHATIWTEAVVRRLRDRGFCMSDHFNGSCNPIYIDDCVDAILLALIREGAIGETFIISGGEKFTWNEYYGKYNKMLGLPPLRSAGKTQLQLYWLVRKMFDLGYNYLRPKYGEDIFFTYSRLRERKQIPNLKAFLQKGSLLETLGVFSRPAYYSIEKAKRKLGFEPKYNFDSGMALVRQWLLHTSQVEQPIP